MNMPDNGQILFHEAGDLPYGVFSPFAPTPVWISGRRYKTVEHWYQAMRAVGDEHEWIREADGPAEAKLRAAAIEPRRYWTEEKVLIMYRGTLAKCRQHPALADLLMRTGDAEIHEYCGDLFWGFDGRGGQDWLGKILCHVRAYLRSSDPDGPLAGLVRGRFLNYETAVSVRSIRNGGQPWLVHLIRYRESVHPIDTLRQIICGGILRASRQLNGYYAVCFSAAPLRDLELRVFDKEARLRSVGAAHVYSPFGVAVTYDFARELGIRPVLPVPTEVTPVLPRYLRFLSQPYSPGDLLDYTHEDEWRAPFDVDIREGPFALVVPKGRTLSLTSTNGILRDELIRLVESAQ
jgi:ribA/ribD-fused uncharacterized protein